MSHPSHRAASRLRTVAFSSLANLALPLTTIITGPLLARTLGPEGRGLMAALYAPLAFANLMFTLGLPDALTYFLARGSLPTQKALRIVIAGGLLCGSLACVTLWLSAPRLYQNQTQQINSFGWLLLSLPVTLALSSVRGILQGRQQFGLIIKERLAGALLRLLVLAVMAAMKVLTPLDAVWVAVGSQIMGSLYLLKGLGQHPAANLSDTRTWLVARYAGAAALGTVGSLLVIRLDQVLMVFLTSQAELAYYAVAVSMAELPLTVVGASRDLAFSLTAERGDPQIVARFCRLTLLASGLMCLLGAVATPFAFPLLFGKLFSPAVPMMEILLAGTLGRAVTTVIGAGLMTVGHSWVRSAIQIGGALFTAALLFVLVPRWGGIGSSWVTSLTFAVMAFASILVYAKATGLTFSQCLVPTASDANYIRSAVKANWERSIQ